jgi:hypothetical protein
MSTGESLKGERVSAVRAERVDSSVALKSPSFGDVDRGNPDMRQNHEEHFPIVCSCVKQDQAESVALRTTGVSKMSGAAFFGLEK